MAEEDLGSATLITMMQCADFRNSYDSSQSLPLNRTRFRRILCQRQMSPDIQIVTEVSFENPSQMRLSEHDDMVEAPGEYFLPNARQRGFCQRLRGAVSTSPIAMP